MSSSVNLHLKWFEENWYEQKENNNKIYDSRICSFHLVN